MKEDTHMEVYMISDLIIQEMPLIKINQHYFGQCPLCHASTFLVNDETDSYECLNCHVKGNHHSFKYLMGHKITPVSVVMNEFKEHVFQANNELAIYFQQCLDNKSVKKYISQRNISETLLKDFHIGFAFGSYTKLFRHYSDDVLLATGAFKIKDNQIVPLFFNRLMFPIRDIFNNIVGWGGRKIDDYPSPKYINSPESSVFLKRENLFGMNIAKKHAEKGIIVCEGYMDVASLHTHGFKNAVASLGTALTEKHVELLRNYTDTLYLCYDNDDAGLEAVKRALTLTRQYQFNIRIITMDKYKDADEYMNNDIPAFQKCIDNAKDVSTFIKDNADKYEIQHLLNILTLLCG